MSYKENLKINGNYVFNSETDAYFQKIGFYNDFMSPRFMNSHEYSNLKLDIPCLRFDGDWWFDNSGVQRVFMNKNEIYVERQTGYRSFDSSDHHIFDSPPSSVEEIEEILDSLVKKYDS